MLATRPNITNALNIHSTILCTTNSLGSYLNMWLQDIDGDDELCTRIYTAIRLHDLISEDLKTLEALLEDRSDKVAS